MIWVWIVSLIVDLLAMIFSWLPVVTVSSIPIVGNTLNTVVPWMFGVWNSFMITVPYAIFPFHVFLYAIIPF